MRTLPLRVNAGPFRVKYACKVYPYENTLYKLNISGAQLKAIMEQHAGRLFNQFKPGDVTVSFNGKVRMYEYDTFGGVDYKIDISKPVGQRIVDLTFNGKPVADDQRLTLAASNYRYGQYLQEKLVTSDDVVESSDNWGDNSTVRAMVIDYVKQHKTITPSDTSECLITGVNFDDPQKDLIYQMIREGKIQIPVSVDGRTPNCKSINANELRAEGVLPALSGK